MQLNRGRPVAAGGFLPIPWREIGAWATLQQIQLLPWELDAIAAIDDEWLDVMSRKTVTLEDLNQTEQDEADD